MLLYLSIIFVSMAIIVVFNGLYNLQSFSNSIFLLIGVVVIGVILEIIIDLIFAGVIHVIKDSKFEKGKLFDVSKKERNFYEKLRIRSWKDKILELGGIGGFSKKHLQETIDIAYVDKFIIENNKGVVVHLLCMFLGFLIMLLPPLKWSLVVSLPIAIVNFVLNLLPLFVLRYNTPKLIALKSRMLKNHKPL